MYYDKDADRVLRVFMVSCLILAIFGVWKVIEIGVWICQHLHWD